MECIILSSGQKFVLYTAEVVNVIPVPDAVLT